MDNEKNSSPCEQNRIEISNVFIGIFNDLIIGFIYLIGWGIFFWNGFLGLENWVQGDDALYANVIIGIGLLMLLIGKNALAVAFTWLDKKVNNRLFLNSTTFDQFIDTLELKLSSHVAKQEKTPVALVLLSCGLILLGCSLWHISMIFDKNLSLVILFAFIYWGGKVLGGKSLFRYECWLLALANIWLFVSHLNLAEQAQLASYDSSSQLIFHFAHIQWPVFVYFCSALILIFNRVPGGTPYGKIRSTLFFFNGHISRKLFWVTALSLFSVILCWALLILFLSANNMDIPVIGEKYQFLYAILPLAYLIALIWPLLALCCKRFHAHDYSGWAVLWLFVPFVNIFFAIKILFFRGSRE